MWTIGSNKSLCECIKTIFFVRIFIWLSLNYSKLLSFYLKYFFSLQNKEKMWKIKQIKNSKQKQKQFKNS